MIEKLLLRNLTWIKGIAHSFCRNRMDAEDLVGDTILKVLLNADRFDVDKSFRLWVLVIMRNTYRLKLRHTGIVETFDKIPECYLEADPGKDIASCDSVALIEECAKSRVCVRSALLYAHGYSYSEIADIQGVSVNIVKSRILHGRRHILKRLSG
ncbi:MAG: RNA polymerase sigma factor [Bacteroidaceae bacterium]|nr:RNA polymerase sigma factor [Bacteroidaceae bacterium]